MDKINFKNLPNKTTPINAENLNKIQENVEKAINEKSSLPVGGDEGQILAKASNQDNDVEWIDNIGQGGGDTLPIGAILPFSGDIIPNGWLLCDGSSFSVTSYPELFDVIGITYGYDDDRNPKLPDLRGRVAVGKKDATSADDTEFSSLGKTGGEKTHTLTIDEMPSHKHGFQANNDFHAQSGTDAWIFKGGRNDGFILETGGSQPHNNLQPYIVTNYIIKAKQKPNVLAIEDSLPIGTVLDYEGETVPQGYEIVNDSIIVGQEFKTGRIIGNKIEYGKIIVINSLPNTDETLYQTGINVSNIEITDCKGIAKAANNTTFPLPFASAAGSEYNIQLNLRQSGQEYYIVIQVGRDRTELTGKVEIDYLKI